MTSTDSMRPARPVDAGHSVASRSGRGRSLALLGLGVLLLAVLTLTSLLVGSGDMSAQQAWQSLVHPGDTTNDVIVQTLRIPRTQLAILVGAGLGMAGVLIQAVTRNPLADPGILGVNAGAYLAVSAGAAFFGVTAAAQQVWWSIGGAVLASVAVYIVAAAERSGSSPATLVLSGMALGAVLTGLSTAISLSHPEVFDKLRFWSAGSLQGRQADTVHAVLPFIVIGLALAILLARSLNIFALGEDLARALGAHITLTRTVGLVAITLLCGAATAAAGPIAFFGLMVAFVARLVVGPDLRWILATSLVFAPAMFLAADILGRVLVPSELPVGVVTAFLGAPLLIVLIRRQGATL